MRHSKAPSRQLDRAAAAEAVRQLDGREWAGTGVVYVPDGADSHLVVDEAGGNRVHVRYGEHQIPLRCLMACAGVYRAPDVGQRLPVVIPSGDISDERQGPIAMLGMTDVETTWDPADLVLMPRTGGVVKAGAFTGTGPVALAANVEARLQALETAHYHVAPTGGGLTSGPTVAHATYLAAFPPSSPQIANPAHGDPGHVHADGGEPAYVSGNPGAGAGCAATKLEAV